MLPYFNFFFFYYSSAFPHSLSVWISLIYKIRISYFSPLLIIKERFIINILLKEMRVMKIKKEYLYINRHIINPTVQ